MFFSHENKQFLGFFILAQGSQTMYENFDFLRIFILMQGKTSSPGSPASSWPEYQVSPCTRIKKSRDIKILVHGMGPLYEKRSKFRIPKKSSDIVHQEL